ncbi:DUF6891 domain-containing protein [Segniliparus rugosus]|uniref:DUF6891 domain-containing protein n=1 Tax=Segniliparus rugosus (strain ATCC BAA-974 / DSM 45345 / CCUG 50838 / CIP 108380 / JCM 13579 / CDC 945) TaxID=679197 RepID=E5XTZ7_SEGRC|nr:hypothetical protein [Segniliparus rugosus]EFV12166.1 hypothetical protein HMPREF9336_02969 [Segniliparus rugosus ATCC BAA-974]
MAETVSPERVAELREQARELIKSGFAELDDLYGYVADETLSEQQVREIVGQEWQARLEEQRSWSSPSDYDRLCAVFAELERGGIVARMNFTCCGTCGHSEIEMERDDFLPDATGYVFFHGQDADGLGAAPTTLYLRYGTFEEPEADGDYGPLELKVARTIEALLVEHGFEIEPVPNSWTCVTVPINDWRKPLPAPDAG